MIAVIGDLVADQFLRGTINRVSREAPVFIMKHDETETLAGGAANAVVNAAALGAQAIAVGLVGNDGNGRALVEVIEKASVDCAGVISDGGLKTTTKVRVLAGQHFAQRQQVIRIDYEDKSSVGAENLAELKENAIDAVRKADAIIVSDYGYGVANKDLVESCLEIANERGIPLLIDSRTRLKEFKRATSATPNQEEIEQILGEDFSEMDCMKLRKDLGLEALLVTRGNEGMLLIEKNKEPLSLDAVGSKQPVDVTGAGDTVIATYALGLASGLDFADSARLANHAGGIVVMKKGTATLSPNELIASLQNEDSFKTKTT